MLDIKIITSIKDLFSTKKVKEDNLDYKNKINEIAKQGYFNNLHTNVQSSPGLKQDTTEILTEETNRITQLEKLHQIIKDLPLGKSSKQEFITAIKKYETLVLTSSLEEKEKHLNQFYEEIGLVLITVYNSNLDEIKQIVEEKREIAQAVYEVIAKALCDECKNDLQRVEIAIKNEPQEIKNAVFKHLSEIPTKTLENKRKNLIEQAKHIILNESQINDFSNEIKQFELEIKTIFSDMADTILERFYEDVADTLIESNSDNLLVLSIQIANISDEPSDFENAILTKIEQKNAFSRERYSYLSSIVNVAGDFIKNIGNQGLINSLCGKIA